MSINSECEYQTSDISFDQTSLTDGIQEEEIKKLVDVDQALDMYYLNIEKTKIIHNRMIDLYISVDWTVPKVHKSLRYEMNSRSSRLKKMMSELGQDLKTTRFTIEEDEILKANWNSFKEEYGFDDPKYFLPGFLPKSVFINEKKRQFVQYLGRGLPHRTLRSIYDRFYEIYAEESTGRFSYVEDQIILAIKSSNSECFQRYRKSKVLSELLGRKKVPLIRRYNILTTFAQRGGSAAPINWSDDVCRNLISAVLEKAQVDDIALLEDMDLEPGHWEEIGERLGINGIHLYLFWKIQLSQLLFAKECISRNNLRCLLMIWFLAHPEIKKWDDISWLNIGLDLSAPRFICFKVFYGMVTTYVPEELWDNIQDCVQYLYNKYFDLFSSKKLKDRYLRRIDI